MTDRKNTLYERVKELRKNKRMSQDDLVKKCGYTSRSSISKLEKGEFNLPSDKIVLLANALDTTPAYLMGWEDDPSPKSTDEQLLELIDLLSDEQKASLIEFIKQIAKNKEAPYSGTSLSLSISIIFSSNSIFCSSFN